ncbi:helix-turn-helix transcriptional regulator [Streptosporangium sp. 'caverna']|uniref:helix-turn-helix transcriptional regulator n=1 Tax=Streptosporangium sp. 'caverna' TaxID=2202249 RepID=UPI000D7E8BC3|nr:helix-turn-helix transcriptional regulator [Streptosporangium sp. 'caverna']AWS40434.1 transcriptional regulator [Streptosporangium sp. 'caverna']
MGSDKLLGEFLRARREVTSPEHVGMLRSGPSRTPGLRRQEVAMLAGVSTDYYVRLEQGREHRPSDRVLDALVRVLNLGPEAAAHLYELAHPGSRQRATTRRTERVDPDLLRLMRSWPHTPALVFDRWQDVLARNPLAAALHSGLKRTDNMLSLVFLDPAARDFYRDWERIACLRVAQLRAATGADLDNPYLTELVGELSRESADFRRLWARHDVYGMSREIRRFRHHEVGDLDLVCELFGIVTAPGQQLVIFHAEPASPSEQALTMLGNLATMASCDP